MANIRKPTAKVVNFSKARSLGLALGVGLAASLLGAREGKTAAIERPHAAHVTHVIASPAPIVEQPKIELLHDIVESAAKPAAMIAIPKITKAHHTVKMIVTAYCPCPKCCGPDAMGLTASGKDVTYNNGHFVAADKSFAFGTNLIIPGYNDGKPVEVIDRGGAIKGNKLDVFFPTHEEALQWGRRTIEVTVID
jgi:3D (Asp-Asp-Asp) domain-containing protein